MSQLPLGWSPRSDPTVEANRVTVDEARWEAEQAAKRREIAAAKRQTRKDRGPVLLVLMERRCGRCEHWDYPSRTPPPKHVPVTPFGDCAWAGVMTQRLRNPPLERGQVVDAEQLRRWAQAGIFVGGDIADPLRTMATFGCRSFTPVTDVQRDPDADLTDEQRDALEEGTQWAS